MLVLENIIFEIIKKFGGLKKYNMQAKNFLPNHLIKSCKLKQKQISFSFVLIIVLKYYKKGCFLKIIHARENFKWIKEQLYWIKNHNNTCDNRNPPIHDNIANVTKNVYGFDTFKENMINFINKNPFVSYTHFKEYAIEIF